MLNLMPNIGSRLTTIARSALSAWLCLVAASLSILPVLPTAASAFGLFPDPALPTVSERLEQAARWTAGTGLSDGIQVGIEAGFAEDLQLPGESLVAIEQALIDGFEAWENDVLGFQFSFDDAGVAEGPTLGLEVDVFAVPASHPIFGGIGFFGVAAPNVEFVASRTLANGQSFPGSVITGVDLYFNIDQFALLAPLGAVRLEVLTRVAMHEMGHGIGLGHPNDNNVFGAQSNYDDDLDPFNIPILDPVDPFAAFSVSLFPDNEAIMSNAPCGPNPTELCAAAIFVDLQPDDLAGLDLLYLPEPSGLAVWFAGGLGLFAAGRHRNRGSDATCK